MCGIYRITNIVNGKFYIGSSVNFCKRWSRHRKDLERGIHRNKHLQASWDKYGAEKFKFELIEELPTEMLLDAEQWYLTNTYCCDPEYGYNFSKFAGGGMRGRKLSDEHKAKLLAANLGNKYRLGQKASAETKAKIGLASRGNTYCLGYKHSEETKAKRRGRKTSEATKKKLSEALRGREGKKHSEETRIRMSISRKGRVPWNKGKKMPDEERIKISKALKGRKRPPGVTEKIKATKDKKAAELKKVV